MKVIDVENCPHLCIFSNKRILAGEELRYDYGVDDLPWRKKRVQVGLNIVRK